MKDHNRIRQLLPLAAADALTETEAQTLKQHLRECTACAAELDHWRALGNGLKELPTPQAPAQLVARTRAKMDFALTSRDGRSSQDWLLTLMVLFTWALTLASWPLVRLASDQFLNWLHWGFDRTWFGLAAYAGLGWLTAGVAALLLAMQQRHEREAS